MNSHYLRAIVLMMMLNAVGGMLLALDESVDALIVFLIAMVGLVIIAAIAGTSRSQAPDDK